MPKFKVYSSQLVYHVTEIEAQDEDQAQEIALADDCLWNFFDCANWQIDQIKEAQYDL
jgi:hypothetical protein